MNTRSFALLAGLALGGLLVACSSPTEDDASSTDSAISGSLASARACAIRDAYAAASLDRILSLTAEEFAAATKLAKDPTALAWGALDVNGVGRIYLVENASRIDFYSGDGVRLASSTPSKDPVELDTWFGPSGAPLNCTSDAASSSSSSSSSSGENGNNGATTCLSKAPIDATQYAYMPARPPSASCTPDEARLLSIFYKTQAAGQDVDMHAWRAFVVSAPCASCVFSKTTDSTWTPIVENDKGSFTVDRGGCIEQVSGNQACGRAYQQYQTCTIDACLKSCATQEEFTRCRQDTQVNTTSCRDAFTALENACGETNLRGYETACEGTTYTFEGPIRVACVQPPTAPSP